MLNEKQQSASGDEHPADADAAFAASESEAPDTPAYEESIVEELGALIDDAGLYLTAEIAFQKTRARLAGKAVGAALAFVVLAIILLHIAIIALAVGLVIALEPLVTIWGAIAIVVGLMLLGVGILVYAAARKGMLLRDIFSSPSSPEDDA
ncbi:MAG: phage holin family protein [Pseudomonadota bacterium]|nr:phage holin family protein [Pseudomonadota bacterium]